MKKILTVLAALATLGLSTAQAQLLNGALDATEVADQNLATPTNWDVTATGAITGPHNDGASSELFAGAPAGTIDTDFDPSPGNQEDRGLFYKAFSGNTTRGPMTVNLTQDVAGAAGNIYTLTGYAGAEANYLSAGSEFAIEFLDAANLLLGTSINPLATLQVVNGQPLNYKQYTVVGVSPLGTATVRVRASMLAGIPNPLGGGQAFVVDDFTLTSVPVPEPATIALMGLGLVGIAAARRRK